MTVRRKIDPRDPVGEGLPRGCPQKVWATEINLP